MGAEAGEEVGLMDDITDPAAGAGGIIENQQGRNTADELEDILQTLAYTFRGFHAEHLAETIVAVRKGHGQIFFSAEFSCFIEISVSEIHLRRTGIPDQFQVRPLDLGRAALLQITLDNAVASGVSLFLHQPFVDPPCRVLLFAPVLLVFP